MKIKLRDKRQITLPSQLTTLLGLRPGDSLDARVEDGTLILRPSRKAALDALEAIRSALEEAGVTEEELLESGRQIRKESFRENYPKLAEKYGI